MPGGLSDEQFRADPSQSFRGRNWLSSPWNISALTATYRASDKTTISLKSALNISARNLVWKNEDGGPQRADSIDPATNQFIQREVQREAFLSSTTELRLLTNYRLAGKSHWLAAGLRYFLGTMSRQGGGPGSTGTDFDLGLYGGSYGYDLRFSTWNVAPFVECLFRIGERLSLTPGLRYEYLHSSAQGYVTDPVNSKDVPVSRVQGRSIPLAGVGIQYKLSEGSQLYGNISQAYRPTDYSNQTPVGVSSKINPNLKDASGYNAEIGWRGTGKDWLVFDAGLFYLSYKNRIGLETLYDVSGNLFTYRTNVADSRHQGAEVYVEISPFKIKEEHSYKINVSVFNSFAWIDARYENGVFHGNSVEFAPKVINRTGITGSYKMYSSSLVMSYTADEFADANNTVRSQDATVGLIPAYTVLDWSFSMKIRKYSFKVGINNLMDRKYFTIRTDEYPGPGIIPSAARNFYLGFATKF
jgi:Fe(3+) dicitrate transport protein